MQFVFHNNIFIIFLLLTQYDLNYIYKYFVDDFLKISFFFRHFDNRYLPIEE